MTIELHLLKGLSNKESFNKYKHLLNLKTLSSQSLLLLKDYEAYFHKYLKHDRIDFSVFKTYFFETRHPYLDDKSIEEYKFILNNLADLHVNGEIKDIFIGFETKEFYQELGKDLLKNVEISQLKNKLNSFSDRIQLVDNKDINVNMDINSALDSTNRSNGLLWRCRALREHFNGGLIQGDFGIIAGYVDTGKTSFIASETSCMARQIKDDEYILWLSNEGSWKSILPRIYCASLNITEEELRADTKLYTELYKEKMNGNLNRIQIKDIQGWSNIDIENVIKDNPPKLLIIDLLDHVQGFDKYQNKETSTEKYNKLYQWAREAATKYCPIIGISQLNGDGENEAYPSMSKLRGSRVDKQAAATFQIHIGAFEGEANIRYLSMPKDKVSGKKGWRAQVKFDPLRSRYE